ncbi:MAG: ABC transporter substrate-binding protein [Mariprofundales bacterium]
MIRILRFLLLSTLLLGGYVFVVNYALSDQSSDTFNLALVAPLQGSASAVGRQMQQAALLAVEQVNAKGGIRRQIVLDVFDDRNDATQAEQRALEIIEHRRALAVIGHNYSKASLSAGQIYKKYGIPAITPTSTLQHVTQNNDWFFASVANDGMQGQFIAHYVYQILKQKQMIIVAEDQPYGDDLARVFDQTFSRLGGRVLTPYRFQVDKDDVDKRLRSIAQQIKWRGKQAGNIFLAMHAEEGVKLVRYLRDMKVKNRIIVPSAFDSDMMRNGFADLTREQMQPGYYSDGIMVVTPLLFDTANRKAQEFREAYILRWGEEPDWRAAYTYDTIKLLVQAIANTDINGSGESLQQDRLMMRDYLTEMKNSETSYDGITGYTWFDPYGAAPKTMTIGIYERNKTISALTQLQLVRHPSEVTNLAEQLQNGSIFKMNKRYMYNTNVTYAGVHIDNISDINPILMQCKISFHVWFSHQGNIDPADIQFTNAVEKISLGTSIDDETNGDMHYRLYQASGIFTLDAFNNRNPLGVRSIGLSFNHNKLSRHKLIYVSDFVGMGIGQGSTLKEKLEETAALSTDSVWSLLNALVYQDIAYLPSLGKPEYLFSNDALVEFSRFNVEIKVASHSVTLRGAIPEENAILILLIISTLLLLLWPFIRRENMAALPIWLVFSLGCMLWLVAAEIYFAMWLPESADRNFYLSIITIIFDALWWFTPASLLVLALSLFVWQPLEKRSGQKVPALLRHFAIFIIFLLAWFGVIAFVFDQKLTGLLATSGLFAMIIGLAVQMNISNIFSGIAINIEHPFRIGDQVSIGGDIGRVMDMTWRTTRLEGDDGSMISIPNSAASESVVYNFTAPDNPTILQLELSLNAKTSPDKVEKILCDAALALSELKTYKPQANLLGFQDGQARYELSCQIENADNKDYYAQLLWKQLWITLEYAGLGSFKQQKLSAQQQMRVFLSQNHIPIFRAFNNQALDELSQSLVLLPFKKGDNIVQQGDSDSSLYIIQEGVCVVLLEQYIDDDKLEIELARMGAGRFFGEMALLTGEPRLATVQAISNVLVLKINKYDLAPHIASHPEVAIALGRMLAERQLYESEKRGSQNKDFTKNAIITDDFVNKVKNFFAE